MLESDGWWNQATPTQRRVVRWWMRSVVLAGRDPAKTSDRDIDLVIASLSPEKIEEMKRRAFEADRARGAAAVMRTAAHF